MGQHPFAAIQWTLDGNPRGDWPEGRDESTVTLAPDWIQNGQKVKCKASVPANISGVLDETKLDIKGALR